MTFWISNRLAPSPHFMSISFILYIYLTKRLSKVLGILTYCHLLIILYYRVFMFVYLLLILDIYCYHIVLRAPNFSTYCNWNLQANATDTVECHPGSLVPEWISFLCRIFASYVAALHAHNAPKQDQYGHQATENGQHDHWALEHNFKSEIQLFFKFFKPA